MKKDNTKLPVEIDWKVSGSKILFEVQGGGELFAMDGERFGLLLNGDCVNGQLRDAVQEKLYPAEWGLEKFVEAQRLLRKGLNMPQIASLWGTSDAPVRSFYSAALQKFQRDHERLRQEAERQGSTETEKDTCRSLKRSDARPGEQEGPGQDFLEVPMISRLLKELWSTLAVASRLMLDHDDFKAWVKANQKYLDLF